MNFSKKECLFFLYATRSFYMTMSDYPILLTKKQLLAPILKAKEKLTQISSSAPMDTHSALFREGLFVLAISTIEVMLADVLAEFLRKIPSKLPEKNISIAKESLIERQFSLIEEQTQLYINSLSYKKLDDFLDVFNECLSIDIDAFRSCSGATLQEIKESRNLLIHNDLRVNSTYLSKAGSKARGSEIGVRLDIDAPYFEQSIKVLFKLCESCESEIEKNYKNYTKIKAIRALWNYIFDSPILVFEEWWDVDEEADSIHGRAKNEYYGLPASSEKIFLSVWFNHYFGPNHEYYKYFSMRPLDDCNKEKMLWLISVLRDFRIDT